MIKLHVYKTNVLAIFTSVEIKTTLITVFFIVLVDNAITYTCKYI